MKTIAFILLLVSSCENPVPVEPEEPTRINFITEWTATESGFHVVVRYDLMPKPVYAEKIYIEIILGGEVVFVESYPFGLEGYDIPWTGTKQVQIIIAYIIQGKQ